MSFAASAKTEICRNRAFIAHHRAALLYGLLFFGRGYSCDAISIYTENSQVGRLFSRLLYEVVEIRATVTMQEHSLRGVPGYRITVDDSGDVARIRQVFGDKAGNIDVKILDFTYEESLHGVLSGVYLACGNMTDPAKSYQLEFSPQEEELARFLSGLLQQAGIGAKVTRRRGQPVVYTKDSEQIEEFLTMAGAVQSALELMNVKIYKDVRNNVNRVTNCETANIEKTVAASAAQREDIAFILEARGLGYIPEPLRELAQLRLAHPEMSLSELGNSLAKPLSRSGVNHRLKKLTELARQLQKEAQ